MRHVVRQGMIEMFKDLFGSFLQINYICTARSHLPSNKRI